MTNFKKAYDRQKEGKIVYYDGIINGIVLLAVSELDDVEVYNPDVSDSMRNRSIKVKFNKDSVVVDVTVKVNYTKSISDVAFKVQEVVRHSVETMTEYHIESVNVHVRGVSFEDVPAEITEKTTEN